jgi:lipid-A-disaccharide synthase
MLQAALRLKKERPELQFLIPAAPGLERQALVAQVEASGLTDFKVYEGEFPEVLSICEAGVVASGTASLQAAVVGMPMVVVYRLGGLASLLGRMLIKVDDIALPNLVAGRRVVPELLQDECNPVAIASALEEYLGDPERRARVRSELLEVRKSLGGAGVFDRAAEAVLAELDRPHSG